MGFVERLDDELTRSLQFTDPHTQVQNHRGGRPVPHLHISLALGFSLLQACNGRTRFFLKVADPRGRGGEGLPPPPLGPAEGRDFWFFD